MKFLAYENGITFSETLNVSVTGIIVVLIILSILAVLVVLLSKGVRAVIKTDKKADETPITVKDEATASTASKKSGTPLPDNQSVGTLELYKTDEKTAAVIMAIISNQSGIPLNRLQFNSIKLIEE